MPDVDIKRLLPGDSGEIVQNDELFDRCVVCQFRSPLNKLIKGSYYCPIHTKNEEDKVPSKKLNDRLEKGRTERSKLFAEIEVQYES